MKVRSIRSFTAKTNSISFYFASIYTMNPPTLRASYSTKDLQPRRITDLPLTMESSQYLSEFHIDNDGNFIFVGMNGKAKPQDEMQAVLFVQPVHSDSLYFTYFVPPSISIDNIRLLVDNRHKRYILSSFYSKRPEADIAGLFCLIRDAEDKSEDKRF